MVDGFLTLDEAAVAAGNAHKSTLYRWAKQGLFPAIRRLGPNRTGILISEWQEWLKSRPVAAAGLPKRLRSDGTTQK